MVSEVFKRLQPKKIINNNKDEKRQKLTAIFFLAILVFSLLPSSPAEGGKLDPPEIIYPKNDTTVNSIPIAISWKAVPNASSGYIISIFIGEKNKGVYVVQNHATANTSYVFTGENGAKAGKSYYYFVKGNDGDSVPDTAAGPIVFHIASGSLDTAPLDPDSPGTTGGNDNDTLAGDVNCSGWSWERLSFRCILINSMITSIEWSIWGIQRLKSFVGYTVVIDPENTDFKKDGNLYETWNFVRLITTLLFVLAIVIIAVASILHIDVKNYDIKILFPRLLFIMIYVNLSLLISKVLVDLANVVSAGILEALDKKDLNTYLADNAAQFSTEGGLGALGAGLGMIVTTGIIFIAAFLVGLYIMFLLLVRVVMIWMLVTLAPFAFAMYLFPFTKSLHSAWWSNFSKMLLIGPAVALCLSVGEFFLAATKTVEDTTWLIPFYVLGMLLAAAIIPTALGGKVIQFAGSKMQSGGKYLSKKGANKAWTGRADGKGNLGLRQKLGFTQRDINSKVLNDRAKDSMESISGTRIADGKTKMSFLDAASLSNKIKEKAISEQAAKQRGSAKEMMKDLTPEQLKGFMYDTDAHGNLTNDLKTYTATDSRGYTKDYTAVDLGRMDDNSFGGLQFADEHQRKGATRGRAAYSAIYVGGNTGNNALANTVAQAHRDWQIKQGITSGPTADHERIEKEMYVRTGEQEISSYKSHATGTDITGRPRTDSANQQDSSGPKP